MIKIREITDKNIWNTFVTSLNDYTFLQSWEWGEVQKTLQEKVWRLGLFDQNKLTGVCLALTLSTKRGKILFVPHGPLFKKWTDNNFKTIVDYLKPLAQKNNCLCLRISPLIEDDKNLRNLFKRLGFQDAPAVMHAEDTWFVNPAGSEEEILAKMRKTTRNLVRRGERENITITQSVNLTDAEILDKLQTETVKRNAFVPFSKKFLLTLMQEFFQDNKAALFLGKFDNDITAAALIVFFGKIAFYYVSGSKETKAPVNYLLQWEVIKEARKRGATVYNMWGIAPPNKHHHPWQGLTMFKTGFGGFAKNYLHAQDLPISLKYWPFYLTEKIPKVWRERLGKLVGKFTLF